MRHVAIFFPLRQLMLCDSCHNGLTGAYCKGRNKRYRYYWCPNKACESYHKSIKADEMEAVFEQLLVTITPKSTFWEWFERNVTQEWEKKKNFFKEKKANIHNKLKHLEEKKDRLVDMFAEGLITSQEEFKKKRDKVDNEILATKISHSEINMEGLNLEMLIHQAKTYSESIAELWRDLVHPEQRAKFMRFVFPEGISYCRKHTTSNQKIGYIFNVSKEFEESEDNNSQKSTWVDLSGFPLNQIIEELLIFQEEAVAS